MLDFKFKTRPINRVKLKRKDYGRSQNNVGEDYMLIYNPLVDFLSRDAVRQMRNKEAALLLRNMEEFGSLMLKAEPGLRPFLKYVYYNCQLEDEESRRQFLRVWGKLGL